MLITRGLADSLFGGCKIQRTARQANYSPNYKKSATVGVNYSLTITLSMVLKRLHMKCTLCFSVKILSDVEPEDYDVAVMHDVFLAFGSYEALFLGSVI